MEILRLLWPVLAAELLLKAYALWDLSKQEPRDLRWNARWIWVLIILVVSALGSLSYLVWGKVDAE